mgnify:CR=1 FL=1|nr:MAG TPA: hypothetical protein [Caudoviricetes sp.]DAP98567.1 MAG TPA: hypothetical protein [Caudoviricetes sp.]
MIDIERKVYTPIADALRKRFPGISVSGEYVNAPPKFPYVSIVEQDNHPTVSHLDSSNTERYATVMYEVNVYSDKAGKKKTVCREIMGVIDEMLYGKNFTRISMFPVPNMENGTIYRLTARYEAVTDGKNSYRK